MAEFEKSREAIIRRQHEIDEERRKFDAQKREEMDEIVQIRNELTRMKNKVTKDETEKIRVLKEQVSFVGSLTFRDNHHYRLTINYIRYANISVSLAISEQKWKK